MNHQNNSKNSPLEVIFVTTKKVSCGGEKSDGSSVSGHPLVYLNMGKNDNITCPYCSRHFTIKQKNTTNSVNVGAKNQNKN